MIYGKLIEIFKRIKPSVDENKITMDSRLVEDLAIDSLTMMLLAISVEDEFQMQFEANPNFTSVRDLCNYVAKATGKEIGE